jgi:hypothetical protein
MRAAGFVVPIEPANRERCCGSPDRHCTEKHHGHAPNFYGIIFATNEVVSRFPLRVASPPARARRLASDSKREEASALVVPCRDKRRFIARDIDDEAVARWNSGSAPFPRPPRPSRRSLAVSEDDHHLLCRLSRWRPTECYGDLLRNAVFLISRRGIPHSIAQPSTLEVQSHCVRSGRVARSKHDWQICHRA